MSTYYDTPMYRRAAAERQAERLVQQREEEERREAARRANEDAGARYRAGLEAEKVARLQAGQQRLADELAPDRARLCRAWLADHPDKGPVDDLTRRMRADPMYRPL